MSTYKTKVIELFGLPRTGKTSSSKALFKWFQNQGFRVLIIHERVAKSKGISKLDPMYNYDTAKAFIEKYLWAENNGYDYVIVDRGLLDALVWIEALSIINPYHTLNSDYRKEIKKIAIQMRIKFAFFFKTDISTAIIRDGIRDSSKQTGTIMNEKVLSAYLDAFENVKSELKSIQPNIVELDTTRISLEETFRFLIKYISSSREHIIQSKHKTNFRKRKSIHARDNIQRRRNHVIPKTGTKNASSLAKDSI
ncbi:MAG: AAA family ATPase [Chitinophagales bacterium]|nr:AAA family ATPase [Chitinophagales bacterium]